MLDFANIYQRSDSVVTRDVGGEKVIVPIRRNVGDLSCIYTLNSVGNEVWLLLDGKRSLNDVVSQLESEFAVARTVLVEDISSLMCDLKTEDLVREVESGS